MKIIERIYNVETDETQQFERDATPQEIQKWQAAEIKASQAQSEAQAKAIAKAALLDKLGITEEEAKLLLS